MDWEKGKAYQVTSSHPMHRSPTSTQLLFTSALLGQAAAERKFWYEGIGRNTFSTEKKLQVGLRSVTAKALEEDTLTISQIFCFNHSKYNS